MLRFLTFILAFSTINLRSLEKDALTLEKLGSFIVENIKSTLKDENYLELLKELEKLITAEKKSTNEQLATKFLKENKEKNDIFEVIPGKVQYKLINEGYGKEVQENSTPLITYKCFTINNELLFETKEPQTVSLTDLITGLTKGIIGMKEGEKRIIYIHPDYSSQKDNNLIKFEVELLKAEYNCEIDASLISNLNKYLR